MLQISDHGKVDKNTNPTRMVGLNVENYIFENTHHLTPVPELKHLELAVWQLNRETAL